MTLTSAQWHQRYEQQARWTQNIRAYLYQKCGFQQVNNVLDVGCGTGVLEYEFALHFTARIFGIDVDSKALKFAQGYAPKSFYSVGDVLALPFSSATFDVTLCHFLLLWINRVENVIDEMKRVTHTKGYIMALAEPDYGGRIDYPFELAQIGTWQTEALRIQGADPLIGRKLRSLFSDAGLNEIEVGVLGGQWDESIADQDAALEWQVTESDLKNHQEFRQQADKLKALELASRADLHRILFVPVFYAIGVVPN